MLWYTLTQLLPNKLLLHPAHSSAGRKPQRWLRPQTHKIGERHLLQSYLHTCLSHRTSPLICCLLSSPLYTPACSIMNAKAKSFSSSSGGSCTCLQARSSPPPHGNSFSQSCRRKHKTQPVSYPCPLPASICHANLPATATFRVFAREGKEKISRRIKRVRFSEEQSPLSKQLRRKGFASVLKPTR